MRILKPERLRRGDVIGICAPAGPLASPDALNAGIRYLEYLGYRVELSTNLFRKHGYLAGSDAQRAADLLELFKNKHVKAIFAARGGYGTHRLLSLLDYSLIKRNPKIVVGYSDITALQLALFTKAGLTSVSGPMVVEMPATFTKRSEEIFWRSVTSAKPPEAFTATTQLRLNGKHQSSFGRLLGGNLSLIAALIGTPYFPQEKKSILLLEEIDERPYRIDRMLQQIKLKGILKQSRGIILGDFTDCAPVKGKASLRLSQVFEESFKDFSYPILSGFRYGHIKNSLSFPIGVNVRMHQRENSVEFLESAVL